MGGHLYTQARGLSNQGNSYAAKPRFVRRIDGPSLGDCIRIFFICNPIGQDSLYGLISGGIVVACSYILHDEREGQVDQATS